MSETSIVLQLQELATDPNSNVEELLNKALLVSRKLKIKKFRAWCEFELEGYSGQEIPPYRKIRGELKAHNPVRGLIPFILPPELDEIVTNIEVIQPIGEICNLVNADNGKILYTLTSEMRHLLMQMQTDYVGSPMMPKLIIDVSQLMAIQTKVRNIILNWSLKLEEEGILGKGLKFSEKEKEKVAAMTVTNFNIKNMQGVAGNVTGGTINQNNQMNIQPKDFDSLAKHLMQNKVEFSDIQALQEAIESDPAPCEPNKLGSNVSSWIGSMIGKAANGSWDVGIAVAGTLLAEAISKYYGLG
ncbi:AbiTii domain-containing protein [Acinetobacter wuhouensis]|uniref:AbiTii domain-containing protein n=1 Tax=Acinetobacter wuhouensis TaxID=1879050 RepID=A0A3G2T3U1_9GAMM|nr:hypothetical protein [Acinetobacter wuhouensis]AYO54406.1 hypothetical protein CDG68_12500 [Acinetobacter wuhouensis]